LLEHGAAVFSGHGVSLAGGAFTSNGQLVTLDQNGQVRRWDLDSQHEEGTRRRDLPGGPRAQVRVLSPDGRLAALALGNRVHVFETSTGSEKVSIDSTNNPTHHLVFSRDSDRLVIVDDRIRWLSAVSGEVIATVNQQYDHIESLALSADGLTLAVVHGNLVQAISIFRLDATARRVTPLAQGFGIRTALHDAALTPDGQRIAVGAGALGGNVLVSDTATGREIARLAAHAPRIAAMAFSGDGAMLATADAEGTVKIWADAERLNSKSTALWTLKGHQGTITSVGFSSDGKRLVTTSVDKTGRVWDLENDGAAMRRLEGGGYSLVVRFSPDGQLIAAATGGSSVPLWDAATGRLVRQLPAGDMARVSSVAFSPTDNRLLALGYRYGGGADVSPVALWDIDAGKERALLPGATDLPAFPVDPYSGVVSALTFSPDGKYLVAGFGPEKYAPTIVRVGAGPPIPLKVWELATRRLIGRLNGHTGYCASLDFSRDGRLLATGSRDGTAIIWSTPTWRAIQTLPNPDRGSLFNSGRGMVEDVAFSPDGKTLAMASQEGNVHLWGVATGQLLETLKGHSSAVEAVVFAPNGRTLASGSFDGTVRLWNVETRRELMQLDHGSVNIAVKSLAFSPDGKQLLAGGDGTEFWSTAPIVWNDSDRAGEKLRQAWRDAGIVRAELGQPEAAAAAFAKLMDLTPQSRDEDLWWSPDPAGIGEALARYDGVFARLVQMRPRNRTLLIARFHHLGRRGQWKEAAEMAARIRELDPKDASAREYHRALLLYLGDLEGYRRACREDEAWSVAEGKDPADVEFLGQYRSSRPPDGGPPVPAQDPPGNSAVPSLWGGICDYRKGQFAGAVRQLAQVRALEQHPYRLTLAHLFLAMAHQRLGQPAEARRELDAARTRLDRLGRMDYGWTEWLQARILCNEAEGLIVYAPIFPADPFAR
jgi:WD40 repeat protein